MRIALAPLNVVVGDLDGDVERMCRGDRGGQKRSSADLVVLPELAVTSGIRPRISAAAPWISSARHARRSTRWRAAATGSWPSSAGRRSTGILRTPPSCARTAAGARVTTRATSCCPTTASRRAPLFAAGRELLLLRFGEVVVGPTICEDVWQRRPARHRPGARRRNPACQPLASPYHSGEAEDRRRDARYSAARHRRLLRVLQPGAKARTSWCSTAIRSCRTGQGEVVARAPGSRRRCCRRRRSASRRSGNGCATCGAASSSARAPRRRLRRRSSCRRRACPRNRSPRA